MDSQFPGLRSGFDNTVSVTALQSDGKILLGGSFGSYNSKTEASDYLIGLNAKGEVDSSYSGIGSGFNNAVNAIVVLHSGKILVGGSFTAYNGDINAPNYLIRLNADGSADSTFSGLISGFNNIVHSIAVQTDGKILVGGRFTSYNGDSGAADRFLRLNSNGSVDSSFTGLSSGFDSTVNSIVLQPDGKILVGGDFRFYNGSSSAPDRFLRLNTNGTLDSTMTGLTEGFDSDVFSITLQSDGKIVVGGDFRSYNSDIRMPDHLIRLNSDGSADSSFLSQTR